VPVACRSWWSSDSKFGVTVKKTPQPGLAEFCERRVISVCLFLCQMGGHGFE